jgi:hypothetical protein
MVEALEAGLGDPVEEGGEAPCYAHLVDEDGTMPD